MGQLVNKYMGIDKAQHKVQKAEVERKRTLQKAENEASAKNSDLRRKMQAIQNEAVLRAAGKQFNAITANMVDASDTASRSTFLNRLGDMQAMGAAVAEAAAAGIGGSTVDGHNRTTRLQRAIREEQADRLLQQGQIRTLDQRNAVMENAVNSMDRTLHMADIDLTEYKDPVRAKGMNFGQLALTAVATYFGGPMAGQATASAFDSALSADAMMKNGQWGQAGQQYSQALSQGFQGFQGATSYMQGNGQSWGATQYDKVKGWFGSGQSGGGTSAQGGVTMYGIKFNK